MQRLLCQNAILAKVPLIVALGDIGSFKLYVTADCALMQL